MAGLDDDIEQAVAAPDSVVESSSDSETRLYLSVPRQNSRGIEAIVCGREGSSWGRVRDHGVLDGQGEEGACAMADRRLKIWYDREGDFLEVMFEERAGYFRETRNDQVMEKVDDQGRVIGFSILKVSALQSVPLEVAVSS